MSLSRYGLITPGLTMTPNIHNAWEKTATMAQITAVVQAAERLGFDHIQCSEHVMVPPEQEARRGGCYYDPLASFGYLAALTTTIRFVTSVLVLGYNHPLAIAKRYGTLDVVSGGRVVLGVGVGSLKQEFDLLGLGGVEFDERGVRGDDAMKALRASLGRKTPEYHGAYYDYRDVLVDPCAIQQDMQLWVGGNSFRSLRRAVELGDGWMPFGMKGQALDEMLARARDLPAWSNRARPVELVLNTDILLDPAGAPDATAEALGALFAAGATRSQIAVQANSTAHHIEQLEALAALKI